MDTAYISASAALAGSVIGGLTALVTSWLGQRAQARSEELIRDRKRSIGTAASYGCIRMLNEDETSSYRS